MGYISKAFTIYSFRESIDGFKFPIVAIDSNGKVLFANNSFTNFFGKNKSLVNSTISQILRSPTIETIMRNLHDRSVVEGVEIKFKTKNNNLNGFKANVNRTFIKKLGDIYIINGTEDLSNIYQVKDKMEDYLRYISTFGKQSTNYDNTLITNTLANLPNSVERSLQVKNILNVLAVKICEILNGKGTIIWMKTINDRLVVCGQYGMSENYIESGRLNLEIGKGIVGSEFNNKSPKVFNDISQNTKLYFKDLPRREQINCMITIPMIFENSSIGSINVFRFSNYEFSPSTRAIAKSFGAFSAAILNTSLFIDELQRLKNEYQKLITKSLDSTKRSFIKPIAGMVNHEMKNILNITKMSITNLINDDKVMKKISTTKQKELRSIDKKLSSSVRITKELSEFFSYTQDDELTIINISQSVKRAVNFLSPKIEDSDISIDIEEIDNDLNVSGNYMEFLMIVFNLINNSIKAINKKDKNISPKGNIKIYSEKRSGFATIYFVDDGIGIGNEIMDDIFEPGFSTDLDRGSSGIGLYGSKRIIEEEYNGTLTCQSSVGKGATFSITLPN